MLYNFQDGRPFLKEVVYRGYLQRIEGQMILRYLYRIISAEQLEVFIRSYGEEDYLVQHGQVNFLYYNFISLFQPVCNL